MPLDPARRIVALVRGEPGDPNAKAIDARRLDHAAIAEAERAGWKALTEDEAQAWLEADLELGDVAELSRWN